MSQRWKLLVEYDGADFSGWQRQPDARTVQGELERALTACCRREIRVVGQGRTDRGVHARGQVAHADLPEEIDSSRLSGSLRTLLPKDLALRHAQRVPGRFHARFDAARRYYSYRIVTRQAPLERYRSWIFTRPFDPDLLHEAAERFVGEHDFRQFARMDPSEERRTVCRLTRSEWWQYEEIWIYRIEGDRFLRHMVRRLVGSMVQYAHGRLKFTDLIRMLESPDELQAKGFSAPPQGLCLERVSYPVQSGTDQSEEPENRE